MRAITKTSSNATRQSRKIKIKTAQILATKAQKAQIPHKRKHNERAKSKVEILLFFIALVFDWAVFLRYASVEQGKLLYHPQAFVDIYLCELRDGIKSAIFSDFWGE